jgi:3-isopropylmalate/(R)-2-methylmalate dehydratase small subunit
MKRAPYAAFRGVAAPMMVDNVDTDQIIPSREMKAVSRAGLADGLFAGQRYLNAADRTPNPDFVLNKPDYAGASILIAGENFGCGSSREHAVWALAEFGVKAVVAKSFGEIFHGNCSRNGVLAIRLDAGKVEDLAAFAARDPQKNRLAVDLAAQTVHGIPFAIDSFTKRLLLEGLDPIGVTLADADAIAAFHASDAAKRPWIYS